MTSTRVFRWLAVGSMTCSVHAFAAGASPPAPPPPPPPRPPKACAAPEFRQFDFWLGDWKVTDPNGNVAGTNLITLEMDGCVLHEHWVGSKGGNGESFNIYDGATKQWHQTWVDNGGTLLSLIGGIVDGRVRQTWTVSSDGGKTWATSFDGYYSKK